MSRLIPSLLGVACPFCMKPLIFVLSSLVLLAPLARAGGGGTALWTGSIQPLLDENCVKCHGPLKQKSGLALDTVEGALKGNEDGKVINPGKPDDSPLIAALSADADPHMPPKKQLTAEEIAKVREWITALAKPEAAPEPKAPDPALANLDPTAAIDHFLQEGWRDRSLTPAPLCDDRTFVRRIYLDLAGRIPTPEETASFLSATDPQKRVALVDRLLASDEYARTFRETWDVLLMGRNAGRREQRRREQRLVYLPRNGVQAEPALGRSRARHDRRAPGKAGRQGRPLVPLRAPQ